MLSYWIQVEYPECNACAHAVKQNDWRVPELWSHRYGPYFIGFTNSRTNIYVPASVWCFQNCKRIYFFNWIKVFFTNLFICDRWTGSIFYLFFCVYNQITISPFNWNFFFKFFTWKLINFKKNKISKIHYHKKN